MPTKAEMYSQMADKVATQLVGSWKEWTAFLTTAARLYKYPFHEQMMIYAQRPDATACAEYDLWNEKMGRYVRRGSKGIALVDDSGDKPRLRYVFDISDTGTREHSRTPWLWQLEEQHIGPVSAMLERSYGVAGDDLAQQLTDVAGKLASEYWDEHQRDFRYIVDGSFLAEYDDYNIEVQFKSAATVSIAYALMSRCGLDTEQYFQHEDFMPIFDFNTPATVGALGAAVSQINQQVLRQIGVTIQNYEREQLAGRSVTHGEQPDLHDERRLSDSRPEADRTAGEAPGQVRQDAESVPEGTPSPDLQSAAADREAVSAPHRDRRDSAEPSGADDAPTGGGSGRDGAAEIQRPDALGGPDEHLQGSGRGDSDDGAYSQLSFFLSEAEQIRIIDEAENVKTSSAFSFAQADIDHVLRLGGNTYRQRERIVAAFEEQKSTAEIADTLKNLYHGGNGIGSITAWYTVREIHKLLRNAFNQAVRWELIARNPVLNATLPKEEHKEREIWTADMLAKAMEVCDDPILLLALNLAFSCSLRMGEMLGLTWDCVDVSPHSIDAGNASIFVNKELQRVTRGALDDLSDKGVIKKFPPCIASTHTALVLKEPKTKTSIRRVYLPKTVAKMLVDRKAEIDELKDLFGDEYIDNDLVFCTSNGRPMESQIINRAFNKLIKENGFPHVVFHSLRHSSITYKLKLNGGDMKAVQGDSGHAQMKMVADVYSHIIDEDRCINAQRFEDAFYSQAKAPEPAIQEVEEKETGTTTPENDTAKILELLKNPETAALLKQIVSAL